ncbi:MAG: TetR/AcrR family transcriptional regulator [Planctomycetia bacterium]|nr:TetR/AcrR family transcriptional regulator [Planctomycetia bacterium]
MGRPRNIEDEALLAAARALFVKKGFSATTREIAARARISEAVIYQRHPTKADLFFAAMVPPDLDLDALFAPPPARGSARAHLESVALGMMEYFRRLVPVFLPLLNHPSFDFGTFAHQRPGAPFARLQHGLEDCLARLARDGRASAPDVPAAASLLFSSLHFFAIVEKLHRHRIDDAAIRSLVGALWNGLAPRGKPRR